MLETLRKNVRKLSWTLWLVIVAFIILYIPDLVRSPGNVVARVAGEPIYVDEFQRALQQRVSYYRSLNEGELPEDFMRQVQLDRLVLDQLIRRELILAAARDQNLKVIPQEIRDRILQYEVFTDDQGRFVGAERYRQILRANGLDVELFESGLAEDLLIERFTELVTSGVTVADQELEEAYQRRNEMVQFDFFLVRPESFEALVAEEVSVEEVRAHYEKDPSVYRLPERRRISYLLLDTEQIRDSLEIPEERLRVAYEERLDEFTVPEQIRVRHILFRVPPDANEEEVEQIRRRALVVLEEARSGADFAELARRHSDDPSASAGGDLGWFGRGRMTPEFEEAAFALDEGEISDLVRSPFGFHIIRLEGHREGQVQPFEDVRGQLEQRLAWDRAEELAAERAEQMRKAVLRGQSLEELAREFDLAVQTSPLFDRDGGFQQVASPELARSVFNMGRGRVAEPVRVPRGYVVFRVDEIVEAHVPPFEEVQERVRQDLVRQRAAERAAETGREYSRRLQGGDDFMALANEAGVPIRSTELITREGVVPELGRVPKLVLAAFERGAGESGGPVELAPGYAVFTVREHVQPDWSRFAQEREALRQELLNQRRSRVFEAMLQQLRERYPVVLYEEVQQRVAGIAG